MAKIDLKELTKKIGWQDYLLIALIIFYIYSQISLISQYNALPSPILGGDYYYQLGHVNHIAEGGGLLKGSNIFGNLPGYLPFYSVLVVGFSLITGLEPMYAMLYFSPVLIAIAFFVMYLFLNRIFDNKEASLITLFLYITISSSFIFKYSKFTGFVLMPLFYLFLVRSYENNKLSDLIICGIILGLLGISHTIAFISGMAVLFVFLIYYNLVRFFDFKAKKLKIVKSDFNIAIKTFLIIFAIGFIIAQLYFFKPLFVYGLKTSPHYIEWNGLDFSSGKVMWVFFVNTIKGTFFNFNGFYIITSLLSIAGLALFIMSKKTAKSKIVAVLLAAIFLGTFHYFATMLLLGTNFYPERMNDFLFFFVGLILICFAVKYFLQKVPHKYVKVLVVIVLILIAAYNVASFKEYKFTNQWVQNAKAPLDERFAEMRDFVFENTDVNELLKKINEVPENIRTAVKNHGGGHSNHSFFWQIMAPDAGGEPHGNVGDAIKHSFGGFDKFKEDLTNAGLNRFGSGWAWLVLNDGKLEVYSTANQDSPIMEGKTPILGVDVWEHAYYLKHTSNRGAYLKDWWNVVNWEKVNELLDKAKR